MSESVLDERLSIPRRDVTAFRSVVSAVREWPDSDGATVRLQREFCRRYGYPGVFAVNSGRDGLRMILRAVRGKVPPIAWVPAWTIAAVPQIFVEEGFEVRFIDVDPSTLSLTPGLVERTCTGPGLLLATHYFGLPADMKAICRIAARRGVKIIEDCAHAPAARCDGRMAGSFGLAGFLSFETRKPLNGLGGGLVVSGNPDTAAALAALPVPSRQGISRDLLKLAMTSSEWLMLRRPVFSLVSRVLYSERPAGAMIGAYRLLHARSRREDLAFSDRQAAVVLAQLDGLDAAIDTKRGLASVYDRLLPSGFSRPMDPLNRPHGYYMYVTTHPDAREVGRRLREMGVDCGIGAEVLQNCDPGLSCPGTAELINTAIELPMYCSLTPADCERVCRAAGAATAV